MSIEKPVACERACITKLHHLLDDEDRWVEFWGFVTRHKQPRHNPQSTRAILRLWQGGQCFWCAEPMREPQGPGDDHALLETVEHLVPRSHTVAWKALRGHLRIGAKRLVHKQCNGNYERLRGNGPVLAWGRVDYALIDVIRNTYDVWVFRNTEIAVGNHRAVVSLVESEGRVYLPWPAHLPALGQAGEEVTVEAGAKGWVIRPHHLDDGGQ